MILRCGAWQPGRNQLGHQLAPQTQPPRPEWYRRPDLWYTGPARSGDRRMKPITDTFVRVAPDCPVTAAVVPVAKANGPTVAVIQYELLTVRPYVLTLADLIFETHVRRA